MKHFLNKSPPICLGFASYYYKSIYVILNYKSASSISKVQILFQERAVQLNFRLWNTEDSGLVFCIQIKPREARRACSVLVFQS